MTISWKHHCADAYAQWDGQRLIMGTSRVRREWTSQAGLPQSCSLQAHGQEWIAGPLSGPSINALNATENAGQAQVTAHSVRIGPVGAEALLVEWQGAGQVLRFTALPGSAAIAVQLWRCLDRSRLPQAEDGMDMGSSEASGVELGDSERWLAQEPPVADRLDAFYLQPQHLRLLQVHFQDRTDLHDELVSEQEWLLHPNESALTLCGVLFVLEDVLSGACLAFLKEAPLPAVRPAPCAMDFLLRGSTAACTPDSARQTPLRPQLALYGHGLSAGQWDEDEDVEAVADGYRSWTLSAASLPELRQQLHVLQRSLRDRSADGHILTNTWGDRSRDAALCEAFLQKEIVAAATLGADAVQIDDGWQQGVSANSTQASATRGVWEGFHAAEDGFWQVHSQRFPHGLARLQAQAQTAGMSLGLWFAPDSADDFANWQTDAEVVLDLHRRYAVNAFKIDGVKARTRLGERRLQRFFQMVLRGSQGQVVFDLDVTAEVRPGYWGMPEVGPLFVENRYTDFHRWWPHHTWRNAWQLARWIDPLRLRMEFLNPLRHQDLYADDPLAPAAWPFATIVAMTLPFSPLAWCEISNLDPELLDQASALMQAWNPLRQRWLACHHYSVGAPPSAQGVSAIVGLDDQGLIVIAVRALGNDAALQVPWSALTPVASCTGTGTLIHGQGQLHADQQGLHITLPKQLQHAIVTL